jgi:hypothetical protein
MIDDTFASILSDFISEYSFARRDAGRMMHASEVFGGLAACTAWIVEQFPERERPAVWAQLHALMEQLAESDKRPPRETMQ